MTTISMKNPSPELAAALAEVGYGGSIDTFAQVALYWPGAGPLPVAGIIGLGALASVIALVGARGARRVHLFRARPLR